MEGINMCKEKTRALRRKGDQPGKPRRGEVTLGPCGEAGPHPPYELHGSPGNWSRFCDSGPTSKPTLTQTSALSLSNPQVELPSLFTWVQEQSPTRGVIQQSCQHVTAMYSGPRDGTAD